MLVDSIEVWVVALSFGFALALGGSLSIESKEKYIVGCFVPIACIVAAFITTLLLYSGFIQKW